MDLWSSLGLNDAVRDNMVRSGLSFIAVRDTLSRIRRVPDRNCMHIIGNKGKPLKRRLCRVQGKLVHHILYICHQDPTFKFGDRLHCECEDPCCVSPVHSFVQQSDAETRRTRRVLARMQKGEKKRRSILNQAAALEFVRRELERNPIEGSGDSDVEGVPALSPAGEDTRDAPDDIKD